MKRKHINNSYIHEIYHLKDDGIFPNNTLPVVVYKRVLNLPVFFASNIVRKIFRDNNWKNSWKSGIFTYHHYHSTTHEALGVIKGKTTLLLGGQHGCKIDVQAGDVLIIPAGVAHKNLGNENQITCIGAYPNGKSYDILYGKKEERPGADERIIKVPKPLTDPVFGTKSGIAEHWK